ncbi:lysophospholipid acyltransferase family protein [Clostridium paraputrificum]|uniref:lysophospholipid acyltransferase family protein n=1 Tax=Clostridium paraputrificum TaxID=29363 RepID=UPI00325B96BB
MLSPFTVKVLKILPEGLLVTAAKKITNNYLKKFARLHIEGFEELEQYEGPFIFICNHLSNSDGIVLNKLLKEKYDPYFVAGVKLTNDPITNVGTKMVKNIPVKPNTADKEAITTMVKTVKNGENLLIFPEGTRSRTGAMIKGKKGILLLARMTKAKIIPIGMSGTDKLLPIDEEGNMGSETWNEADVTVKFGKPVELPKRIKEEDKHEYDSRCMYILMRSIAELLPEEYRGVYK